MKKALLIAILVGITSSLFAQLDKSSCIPGTVGGSVDVSPSGAATFQLPIQVSPGSHGMQPNLSVVYSSQGGNGLLGWGWNLAGLSSISRTSKNSYYDNTFEAISLTDGDALALDGVRLVKDASGVYHPANNPYTQRFLYRQRFYRNHAGWGSDGVRKGRELGSGGKRQHRAPCMEYQQGYRPRRQLYSVQLYRK